MNSIFRDVETRFFSLYLDDGNINIESKEKAYLLDHNSIMEEFDELYEREQELMKNGN